MPGGQNACTIALMRCIEVRRAANVDLICFAASIPPSLRLNLTYIFDVTSDAESLMDQRAYPHPTLSLIRSLRSQGEGQSLLPAFDLS